MNDLSQKELTRAKKALSAAKALLEYQLYEDCVSRAYYAVLHAAKELKNSFRRLKRSQKTSNSNSSTRPAKH
jgi:uncharacterized protein (UPF0332 family)